jgi:repressor of nif and glnA expression
MSEKADRKRFAVLRLLKEAGKPLGSSKITATLQAMGHEITERTARYHLLAMDRQGLTENLGRRGRTITDKGLQLLAAESDGDTVGYLASRIDQITYRMDFDLAKKAGTVVVNVSVIERTRVEQSIPLVKSVFAAGYAMGRLVTLFPPGQRVGEMEILEGYLGIGTVCSVTLNGVLLAHGIPTHSRFGGLLELRDGVPLRFAEMIHYEGTTVDPLELFIGNGMTDYTGATRTGNGRIGVSFREIPAGSRDRVVTLARALEDVGLGGFLAIGWPGQPLLGTPVSEGSVGTIVIGGLNPAAILVEHGIRIHSRALAALADYQVLFSYEELDRRARGLVS